MEELESARSFLKRVRGAFNYRLSIFNASLRTRAAARRRLTGAAPVTSRIPQISTIPPCEASRSFVYANIPRACARHVRLRSLKDSIVARADMRKSDSSDRRPVNGLCAPTIIRLRDRYERSRAIELPRRQMHEKIATSLAARGLEDFSINENRVAQDGESRRTTRLSPSAGVSRNAARFMERNRDCG